MLAAHACDAVDHAPAVAVELRKRVQVDVSIAYPGVPAKRRGVQPDCAMAELYTLGTRRGSACVVDGCRCVFIRFPRGRRDAVAVEQLVGFGTDDHLVFALNRCHRGFQFGVDQQHPRTRVFDDVLHFFGDKAEVDWHQNASRAADAIKSGEQPSRVLRDHGNSIALGNPEGIKSGSLRSGPFSDLLPCERTPALGRLIRLIDNRDAIAIDLLGPTQKIDNGQRNFHDTPQCSVLRFSVVGCSAITHKKHKTGRPRRTTPSCVAALRGRAFTS